MRQYRRAPRPNRNWLYKGFLITKLGSVFRVTDIMGSVLTSVENVKAAQNYIDAIFRKRFSAKRVNPADMKFIHERVRSPKKLEERGLTKYRSKVTPSGDVLRIAFPAGKRKKGSGKLQAILHKNPLTSREVLNIRKEAAVHRAIKGSHIKMAYYQGMAEGMDDIAKQYAMNPLPVEIYSEIKEIIAKKGPGHKCDAACKRANHTYRHKFTKKAGVFGHPDGTISIQ